MIKQFEFCNNVYTVPAKDWTGVRITPPAPPELIGRVDLVTPPATGVADFARRYPLKIEGGIEDMLIAYKRGKKTKFGWAYHLEILVKGPYKIKTRRFGDGRRASSIEVEIPD